MAPTEGRVATARPELRWGCRCGTTMTFSQTMNWNAVPVLQLTLSGGDISCR